jgi:hypothetical protein
MQAASSYGAPSRRGEPSAAPDTRGYVLGPIHKFREETCHVL